MALFGKKKSNSVDAEAAAAARPLSDPRKAHSFFEHARTVHETSNYEYATTLWLQGLARDPASMTGLEGFVESAQAFVASRQKFGPSKDQEKAARDIKAASPITRMIPALLNWGTCPLDAGHALKAIEAMAKVEGLDLGEQMYWIGEKALAAARRDPKSKKDIFVRLKSAFTDAGIFDLAVKAGEMACELDPNDRALQLEVRNLSAQATMSSGGYEKTGEAGGFRANIRDADAQRKLEEQDRIVKTEDVMERAIADAKENYEARPTDTPAIMRYARALLDRATSADEKTAFTLLNSAYEQTQEFRFRQLAGDIRIRQGRRKVAALRARAADNPGDDEAKSLYERGQRALLHLEAEEFALRVKAYPTDLGIKFELGRRFFDLGKLEEAIELFQQARRDAKRRAECLSYLGRAFLGLGWQSEAIETLREAIAAYPNESDDTGRSLRYALMEALEGYARESRDIAAAEEAGKIASSIAMEQIGFRDVRDRRAAIQTLIKEIRATV